MFPKFDSEVIETVLRSNDGAVDKTVDQLLAMSMDNECAYVENMIVDLSIADQAAAAAAVASVEDTKPTITTSTASANASAKPVSILNDFNDSPPSYNEFLALKISETSTSDSFAQSQSQPTLLSKAAVQETDNSKSPVVLINDEATQSVKSTALTLKQIESSIYCAKTNEKINESASASSTQSKPQYDVGREFSLLERKSRVLIGELPNSFLRIKLSAEQVKKFKTNIKKAKRNEITAILNNVI